MMEGWKSCEAATARCFSQVRNVHHEERSNATAEREFRMMEGWKSCEAATARCFSQVLNDGGFILPLLPAAFPGLH